MLNVQNGEDWMFEDRGYREISVPDSWVCSKPTTVLKYKTFKSYY